MNEFDERKYYDAYKIVRNRFRNFDSRLLIAGCLNYLHQPAKDDLEQLKRLPWLILLLIKWILLDEQSFSPRKQAPTTNDLNELFQLVHDLGKHIRLPTQFDHHRLFFRCISYQQFIYQHEFSLGHLTRQMVLFSDLPDNHQIKTQFRALTGIDINKFLELAVALLARFIAQDQHSISVNWFSSLGDKYSRQDVVHFLSSLSKSLEEAMTTLQAQDNHRRPASEYYEQTPFINFPLLHNGDEFICINQKILFRCLEHFIYDRLRAWNPESFMNKFGLMFEKYVERAIRHTGLPYANEDEVRKVIGENGNLIDFVISDGDANIFVDAKAVEIGHLGKVSHISEVVRGKTETSILKAIKQAHDVMHRLKQLKNNNSPLQSKNSNYLVVITYKELYVGNGKTFYESIAKEKIDEIYSHYKGSETISLENMYFLAIEDFEFFVEGIHSKQVGFVEGLERAKTADSHPETMKFDFSQHIASWKIKNELPSYLQDAFSKVVKQYEILFSPTTEQRQRGLARTSKAPESNCVEGTHD